MKSAVKGSIPEEKVDTYIVSAAAARRYPPEQAMSSTKAYTGIPVVSPLCLIKNKHVFKDNNRNENVIKCHKR